MRYLYLTLIILLIFKGYSQNIAPVALNDTIYVYADDSVQFSTGVISSNDNDPDGYNIFLQMDTAFYNGLANITFYFDINFFN